MAGIVKVGAEAKAKQTAKEEEAMMIAFQKLRDEQRAIVSKLSDVGMESTELKIVISTLKTADGNRKCFRLIGGVLCEKTVSEILPTLIEQKEELDKQYTKLEEDLIKKGTEINEFREKHNLKVPGQLDQAPQKLVEMTGVAKTAVLNNP